MFIFPTGDVWNTILYCDETRMSLKSSDEGQENDLRVAIHSQRPCLVAVPINLEKFNLND